MRKLLLQSVLGCLLAVAAFSPVSAEVVGCAPSSTGAGVTLNGRGAQNSQAIDLAGSYRVAWALGAPTSGFIDIRLHRADGVADRSVLGERIVSLYAPTDGPPISRGEGSLFSLPAGRYYLNVAAPSEWAVTITPQR